jgi:hypothetical protein
MNISNIEMNKDSLLLDIINFYKTKELVSSNYYNKYKNLLEYENYADKYWLISDILLYIKKFKSGSYKKINAFYNKNIASNNHIHNQLIVFWGFLTPEERLHFINLRIIK